jgi:hypothetical protein
LYLVDPGKRKGNKDYLIRGAVVRGAGVVLAALATSSRAPSQISGALHGARRRLSAAAKR